MTTRPHQPRGHRKRIARLLIANRGEIAVRVIRTCREMGIVPIAIYSDIDASALHVRMADEAYCVGPAPAPDSYLHSGRIVQAARDARADAVHPGYGFLAENDRFAQAVIDAGLVWVGPRPDTLQALGSKTAARQMAQAIGIPIVPGTTEPVGSLDAARTLAQQIGFPLMLKAVAGGGGKGMRIVEHADQLDRAFALAQGEAAQSFGDGACYLERYIPTPHHVEVQILADQHGTVLHCGERECSIQRRHQKIVEETPSPFITAATRKAVCEAAVALARHARYVNAGTVEFLVDAQQHWYFLEVNPRIQVEHPVTEMVTGIDLVREQIRIAAGERLDFAQIDLQPRGHAIECRIYAEDPQRNFMPSPGTITHYAVPQGAGIRMESGVEAGSVVPVHYDPIIGKLCVWARTRPEAVARLRRALRECQVDGVATSLAAHAALAQQSDFVAGTYATDFFDRHADALLRTLPPIDDDTVIAAAVASVLRQSHDDARTLIADSAWRLAARREGAGHDLDRPR